MFLVSNITIGNISLVSQEEEDNLRGETFHLQGKFSNECYKRVYEKLERRYDLVLSA